MTASKWKDEFYVEIYQGVREGKTLNQMAQIIGVESLTLRKWVANNPALKAAVKKAKVPGKAASQYQTFKDFVHDRLPPEGRALWDEIDAVDKLPQRDDAARETALDRITVSPERTRQQLFLYALLHCNFVKTLAMRKIGLSAPTLAKWMRDPGFRQIVEGVNEHKRDFFESSLIELVRRGDSAATIFAAKTQLRDRGYNERVDVSVNTTVTSKHELSVHDLSPETLRALLDARRKKALQLEDRSDVQDAEVIHE